MALYDWWKSLFKKEEKEEKIDSTDDSEALIEFLEEVNNDVEFLLPKLKKLLELEKESSIHKEDLLKANLEAQEDFLDQILERYEFFQNDVDINGLRLKKVAEQFLKRAQKAGLKELVKEKKQDQKWQLLW